MENKILNQIIHQIKRYNLTESFSDIEQFKDWLSKLNNTQINHFLSLNIDVEEIKNLKYLLINSNLLNCEDYEQRVAAISTLKNGDGCWYLFDVLCKPNFLKSKNFYKDIEMLGKVDNAKYVLWILKEDSFINSPYHDEDLRLIVETRDPNQGKPVDTIVTDALTMIATNIDSIKSPYHLMDMELISTVESDCLHRYPKQNINNLAVNKVSLSDKYHLENMQILATNPIAKEFLYIIMTDPKIINGKYYRDEVEALLNAKSNHTARALYYYIVNPKRKFNSDSNIPRDYRYDIEDAIFENSEYVSGRVDPDYLSNLMKINQIDDQFVMHYVSLLMNPNFINSPYKKFDLELLQIVSCKPIFMYLYIFMSGEDSLNSNHHKKDAVIISQTEDDRMRDLLLDKATNEYSLKSNNHEYDMEYISKLNLNSISEEIFDQMYYYLVNPQGIDDIQHKENLEKLFQGIIVKRSTSLANYLDDLQVQIENNECDSPLIESLPNSSYEQKPNILIWIRKYIKKQR